MKKLLTLFAALSLIHCPLSIAGTNAAVTFRTNDFVINPTNVWASNAVAIGNALTAIGYSPSTNTNNSRFYPVQFYTNGSGQIQIQSLAPSLLSGLIPATNLETNLFSLGEGLDPGLTNGSGQTIAQQITAATNTFAGSLSNAVMSSNFTGNAANLTNLAAVHLTGTAPVSVIPTNLVIDTTNNATLSNVTFNGQIIGSALGDGQGDGVFVNQQTGVVTLTNQNIESGEGPSGITLDADGNIDLLASIQGFNAVFLGCTYAAGWNNVYVDQGYNTAFYVQTSPNTSFMDAMMILPTEMSEPQTEDYLSLNGNSNNYNARFKGNGSFSVPIINWNFINVSAFTNYLADFGDRIIIDNPGAGGPSNQITLPAIGYLFGQHFDHTNWYAWTTSNLWVPNTGGTGDAPRGPKCTTVDFTILNSGSNTANTLNICTADHMFFTNYGVTNLALSNGWALRVITDGTGLYTFMWPNTIAALQAAVPYSQLASNVVAGLTLTNPLISNPTISALSNLTVNTALTANREIIASQQIGPVGNSVNVDISVQTGTVYLTGATGAFSIDGIIGGTNGQQLCLVNTNAYTMTIDNSSLSESTAANRIYTGQGNLAITIQPGVVGLEYSTNKNGWIVKYLNQTTSGGGSGTVTSVATAADSAGVVSWSGSPITTSGTITPTFSKASPSQFGVVEVDNSTITASSGVLSANLAGVGAAITNTIGKQGTAVTNTISQQGADVTNTIGLQGANVTNSFGNLYAAATNTGPISFSGTNVTINLTGTNRTILWTLQTNALITNITGLSPAPAVNAIFLEIFPTNTFALSFNNNATLSGYFTQQGMPLTNMYGPWILAIRIPGTNWNTNTAIYALNPPNR